MSIRLSLGLSHGAGACGPGIRVSGRQRLDLAHRRVGPFARRGRGAIDAYRIRGRPRARNWWRWSRRRAQPRRSLLDAQGHVLVQSDGQSAADGADVIDLYVAAGTYSLQVQGLGERVVHADGLTMPSGDARSSRSRPGRAPTASLPGTSNGDGQLDLAVANSGSDTVSVLLGNGDGTFQAAVNYAVGMDPVAIVAGDFTGDGHLDLAVANQRRHLHRRPRCVACCWATATAPSSPPVNYAVGSSTRTRSWPGDFTGDGQLDLAVANDGPDSDLARLRCRILAGQLATAPSSPQVTYAVGTDPIAIVAGDFTGDGQLDLAVADSPSIVRTSGERAAGQRRRDLRSPRSPTRSGHRIRDRRSWPGTSPATATSTWPSSTTRTSAVSVSAGQRRRHLPAPQVTYAVGYRP